MRIYQNMFLMKNYTTSLMKRKTEGLLYKMTTSALSSAESKDKGNTSINSDNSIPLIIKV